MVDSDIAIGAIVVVAIAGLLALLMLWRRADVRWQGLSTRSRRRTGKLRVMFGRPAKRRSADRHRRPPRFAYRHGSAR